MADSETPRTDAVLRALKQRAVLERTDGKTLWDVHDMLYHARELERELAASQRRVEELEKALRKIAIEDPTAEWASKIARAALSPKADK